MGSPGRLIRCRPLHRPHTAFPVPPHSRHGSDTSMTLPCWSRRRGMLGYPALVSTRSGSRCSGCGRRGGAGGGCRCRGASRAGGGGGVGVGLTSLVLSPLPEPLSFSHGVSARFSRDLERALPTDRAHGGAKGLPQPRELLGAAITRISGAGPL